jgi:hypothetical protein
MTWPSSATPSTQRFRWPSIAFETPAQGRSLDRDPWSAIAGRPSSERSNTYILIFKYSNKSPLRGGPKNGDQTAPGEPAREVGTIWFPLNRREEVVLRRRFTLIRLPWNGREEVVSRPAPGARRSPPSSDPAPSRIEAVPPADGVRSWTPPSSPPTSAGPIGTTGPFPRSAAWWPGCWPTGRRSASRP